ncbi:hypothetical protein ACLI4Z_17010 [Natrialbaceae archaeon A-arb3/5]
MRWTGRIEQLLYDGEDVQRRVEVGSSTVAVTSHRVLAFTPDSDGPAYRYADRPNVRSATIETGGSARSLFWATVAGVLGLSLLVTAALFSFADLVPDVDTGGGDAVGSTGDVVGGALGTVETMLVLVDLGILLGGVLLLAVAAGSVALYSRSRSRNLVIEVRGEADIELPAAGVDDAGAVALELDEAIRPDAASKWDGLGVDSEPNDGFGTSEDGFVAKSGREPSPVSGDELGERSGPENNDWSAEFGELGDRAASDEVDAFERSAGEHESSELGRSDDHEFDADDWDDAPNGFGEIDRDEEDDPFGEVDPDRERDEFGSALDGGREESG